MLARPSPSVDRAEAERFARLRAVYGVVLEADPSERWGAVDRACAGDETLKAALLELLDASDHGSGVLDPESGGLVRALLADSPEPAPLEQVGPYRILRVVGRGGMGTVYLAEQHHPRRQVALKVLHDRFQDRAGSQRFAREVRALARLDHPGIASIYDAGAASTDQGYAHYFAMQYVDGPRLSVHGQSDRVTVADRLRLMALVGDAVQHAHSKGVIHRDLKPGNIIVAEGTRAAPPRGSIKDLDRSAADEASSGIRPASQPKVLDFGVARLLDSEPGEPAMTEAGALLGTVAYMSPEQLAGEPEGVDVRTDVYAMGVILYELLTGRLPYDVRDKPLAEAARIIRFDEPRPMRWNPDGTRARFDRDVETIVAKAMAKDRERRYSTAAAFADDLRRYLAHEPITARPATAAYQLARLARRHRGLAVGVALALLSLTIGLGASIGLYLRAEQQRVRAEHQRQAAEEQRDRADASEAAGNALQGYLIDDLLKAAAPERLGKDARIIDVLRDASAGVASRFSGQPAEEARVRSALAEVFTALGLLEEAEEQRDQAVAVLEANFDKTDERVIAALVEQSHARADMRRDKKAENIAEEALRRARSALPAGHELIRRSLHQLAVALERQSHFGRALALHREVLELAQQSLEPQEQEIVRSLCGMLYCERRRQRGDAAAAAEIARQLAERVRQMPADNSIRFEAIRALMADHQSNGRLDEAVELADALAPGVDRETKPQKAAPMASRLARLYAAAHRPEEAERYALRSHAAYREAFGSITQLCESSARLVIDVYRAWPGHDEAVRAWGVRWIAYRCMIAKDGDGASVVDRIRVVEGMLAGTSHASSAGELLDAVWHARDEYAPPSHRQRRAFLANTGAAATRMGRVDLADEALKADLAPSTSTTP